VARAGQSGSYQESSHGGTGQYYLHPPCQQLRQMSVVYSTVPRLGHLPAADHLPLRGFGYDVQWDSTPIPMGEGSGASLSICLDTPPRVAMYGVRSPQEPLPPLAWTSAAPTPCSESVTLSALSWSLSILSLC